MSLEEMMANHPEAGERSESAAAARRSMECALVCTSCADACAVEPMDMRQCIRTCADCADICLATARILTRQSGDDRATTRAALTACIAICQICAEECARHDHDHCRICAESCRACAAACREALEAISD